MIPQDAIVILNDIQNTLEETSFLKRCAIDMAIEALKERPHGEWISCSERLPEESGQYYVSGGDKVWICSFLIIPTFKGGWCNNVSNPVVEAWMPLPEPYKRGEAE